MKRHLLLIILTLLFVATACSSEANDTLPSEEVEPRAVPTATEVNTEATEAPVEATEVPIEATSAPVQATSPPVEATSAPVEATSPPAEATEVSIEATAVPAEATAVPAEATVVRIEATATPAESASDGAVVPSPTTLSQQGPWLIFRDQDGVNKDLWVANSDGSAITLIAEKVVAPYDFSAIASPSQQHIAFITADDDRLHGLTINVVALPSLQVVLSQPLTSPATEPPPDAEPFADPNFEMARTFVEVSSFAWSPDGRQLAYMGAHDGPSGDLYVFSLDTGQITRLTDGPTQGIEPYWSPDGKYIVHAGITTLGIEAGYGMVAVWAAAVDGSEILTLYDASGSTKESFLGWGSDQTLIVYSANLNCGAQNLRTINLQTNAERVLWSHPFRQVAYDPLSGAILITVPTNTSSNCAAPLSGVLMTSATAQDSFQVSEFLLFEITWSAEAGLFLGRTQDGDGFFSITTDGQMSQLVAPGAFWPVVSPSGHFAWTRTDFQSQQSGEPGVWVGTATEQPRKLFDHSALLPIWTPDGQQLLFLGKGKSDSHTLLYRATAPDFTPQPLGPLKSGISDMLLLAPSSPPELGGPSSDVAAQLLAEGYEESGSQVVSTETAIYEAVLYKHPSPQGDHLLVYKEQAGQKTLLYQQANEFERIDFSGYTLGKGEVTGWHNMNGDGWQLELPILVYNGGNCWICSQLQVIQLDPLNDDRVVNLVESALTPAERNVFAVKELLDLNGDGIAEWRVLDTRYEFAFGLCHACSPAANRIYAWDGTRYRNASAQFPDYYQPQIEQRTAELEESAQSGQWNKGILRPLISLLLNYENAGRLEEGWAVFSSYTDPERYTQISEADAAELIEIREQFRQEYGLPATSSP